MLAACSSFDYNEGFRQIEPGMPYFLDRFDTDYDDLGDWWLDLGAVDFCGFAGV